MNSPAAVQIAGPDGQGLSAEFSAGRLGGQGLEGYADDVLRRLVGRTPVRVGQANRTRVHGLEALVLPAYASTSSGPAEVTVAVNELAARGHRFVGVLMNADDEKWTADEREIIAGRLG